MSDTDLIDGDSANSGSGSNSDSAAPDGDLERTDLRWIGPATDEVLATAGIDAEDVRSKRVAYRTLVEAGVNPGVAAKIRREHSLSWSFEAGEGLRRRSTQIRSLGSDEAEWIAASSGDWSQTVDRDSEADGETEASPKRDGGAGSETGLQTEAAADGSGDPVSAESAWCDRSRPTPTIELAPVEETDADVLAEAGITSVRSLATADPEHVADVLSIDPDRVERWHEAARRATE
ncbi:helix-hairpin-helix domain-containing protein [Halopenitus sp. H-Gu1]|uniref:DUF7409 domain-containing protein n=1 Tax=Halopenitus sp. H-Gu1 TaxID=3242697 RepID=UPI00359CE2C4